MTVTPEQPEPNPDEQTAVPGTGPSEIPPAAVPDVEGDDTVAPDSVVDA